MATVKRMWVPFLMAFMIILFVSSRSGEFSLFSWIASKTAVFLYTYYGVDIGFESIEIIKEKRERLETLLGALKKNPVAKLTDLTISGDDGAEIPIRLYYPNETALMLGEERTVIVYFHGGGWVYGSIDTHDSIARNIALYSDSIVVSVGYRRPPEDPFPKPLLDCLAAIKWTRKNARRYGGDSDKIAVVGDSTGGNLGIAAVLSMNGSWLMDKVRLPWWRKSNPFCAAVLGSPVLSYAHMNRNKGSYARFGSGSHLLSQDIMRWYWQQYLGKGKAGKDAKAFGVKETGRGKQKDSVDWRASPINAAKWRLRVLPPTLIIYAETEVIADEAEDFIDKVYSASKNNSTVIESKRFEKTLHGFFARESITNGPESLQVMAEFLRRHC